MTHLNEDQLLAVRDGAVADGRTAESHLAACAVCGEALEGLRSRAATVAEALTALDEPTDLEAARAAVRARVAGLAAEKSGGAALTPLAHPHRWVTRRAAAVVLLMGATASALPGSPVRDWLSTVLGVGTLDVREEGAPSRTTPEAEVAPTAASRDAGTGIRLAASGALRISVQGLAAGQDVVVRWVDVDEVAVLAPTGSRFTSADGHVEAVVSGGPVTVELPRSLMPATLEVGGRIYLRRSPQGVDIPGPVVEQDAGHVRFRTPAN